MINPSEAPSFLSKIDSIVLGLVVPAVAFLFKKVFSACTRDEFDKFQEKVANDMQIITELKINSLKELMEEWTKSTKELFETKIDNIEKMLESITQDVKEMKK